jgi:hypothetical protein
MEELIKNIILESEEDTGFIGDAIEVGNVALDLLEDGVEFGLDIEEIDELIDNNDILQISKIVCEDCGRVDYILEEVFDEEGYTIPDELETLYVDSDLVDCVDLEAFGDTEIIVVECEFEDESFECKGDCENCSLQDEEFEDYDEETTPSVLVDEFLESLEEIDLNDGKAVYDLLLSKFEECYDCAKMDALAELSDAVDAIKVLK